MSEIDTRQLAEQVYQILRERILRAEYQPGERILDFEVAANLGISRTPVKDAINRLALEGLISIQPRRGTYITEPDVTSFNELMSVRYMMEVFAATQCLQSAKEEAIAGMERAIRAADELMRVGDSTDIVLFMSIDGQFHRALVSGAGNSRLSNMYENIAVHNQLGRIRFPHGTFQVAHEEHVQVLAAYCTEDRHALRTLLSTHITRARSQVEGYLLRPDEADQED